MPTRLKQYFMMRSDIDTSEILSVLSLSAEEQKFAKLSLSALRPLLNSAHSPDDIVAISTLIHRHLDRGEKALFIEASKLLENIPLPCDDIITSNTVSSVTIICVGSEGGHLRYVYAHAIALLTQKAIEKVIIIFTGEWQWVRWSKFNHRKVIKTLSDVFYKQISCYPDMHSLPSTIGGRIEMVLSPKPNEMKSLLGDVVLRFEGPAKFKTTYIYGKAIHALRPVVTGTFSSHVRSTKNSDVTLVRAKSNGSGLIHYIPPAVLRSPLKSPNKPNEIEALIVTVYSQRRIKNALASMNPDQWDAINRLFNVIPNARWLLVGASDPVAARAGIPKTINESHGKKIEIVGHSDLEAIYQSAFAFLALPGVFGGGGGATMAISCGVPVLVKGDEMSDIANTLPEEFYVDDVSEAVDLIERWVKHHDQWLKFIHGQQSVLADRMNLQKKGKELLGHLTSALVDRKSRHTYD